MDTLLAGRRYGAHIDFSLDYIFEHQGRKPFHCDVVVNAAI
jgi:hypothetical protein